MNKVPVQNIGSYQVVEELARGNMGVVYRAFDPVLERNVAIKVILAQEADEGDLARFRIEAKATARLRHPNIVGILSAGSVQGKPFIAMDLIEGESLQQLLKRQGPLQARDAARIIERVARAVDYAHKMGVLHRDLKPANILLDEHGEPQLTDFGLAKLLGRDTKVTLSGEVTGTPVYMPPEQAMGEKERIGPHSDVYALGATLYELLTGQPPFLGRSVVAVLTEVLNTRPTPPSSILQRLDKRLERVCLRALEKEPEKRFLTAGAMADALEAYLGKKSAPGAAPKALSPSGKGGMATGLGIGLGVGALLAAAMGLAWSSASGESAALRQQLSQLSADLDEVRAGHAAAQKRADAAEGARAELEARMRVEQERADRQRVESSLDQARRSIRQGESASALKLLREVVEQDPEHLEARALLATALLGTERLDDALREAERVQEQDPKNAAAIFVSARVHLRHDGAHTRGLGLLEEFLKLRRNDPRANFLKGRALFLLRQDDEAMRYLSAVADGELARDADPQLRARAFGERALLHRAVKYPRKAQADLEAALRIAPNSPIPYAYSAFVLYQEPNSPKALQQLDIADRLDPRYGFSRYLRGLVLMNEASRSRRDPTAQLQLAQESFERGIALGWTTHEAHMMVAQCMVARRDYRGGKQAIDRGLRVLETRAAYALRAELNVRLNLKDEARKDLELALKQPGTHRLNNQNIAQLLRDLEKRLR